MQEHANLLQLSFIFSFGESIVNYGGSYSGVGTCRELGINFSAVQNTVC